MPLVDFFRINMPYGLKKGTNGGWFAFNREYMPIGWNSKNKQVSIFIDDAYGDAPVYTKYKGLTETKILSIIKDESAIHRESNGEITRVFFYSDATNPKNDSNYWDDYFEIIKKFSEFEVQ